MKRPLLLVLVLALAIGIWWARRALHLSQSSQQANAASQVSNTALANATQGSLTPQNSANPNLLLGETILRGYADTNLPPQNDLTLMSRLMENSILLLKSAANHPLSANEDWAGLFLGQNSAHERFLPTNHVAFNRRGQLIDRWGTPLFFHALGGGRFEIRSAGPDRKLWSDDDLQRNPDGSFHRGR